MSGATSGRTGAMSGDNVEEPASDGPGSRLNKGRQETDAERADRNWDELLQELRVTQTGVQLLSGFLLTLPFQQRFPQIPQRDQVAYLIAFGLALVSTGLLVAPVSAHRLLFRRGAKADLVETASRFAPGRTRHAGPHRGLRCLPDLRRRPRPDGRRGGRSRRAGPLHRLLVDHTPGPAKASSVTGDFVHTRPSMQEVLR